MNNLHPVDILEKTQSAPTEITKLAPHGVHLANALFRVFILCTGIVCFAPVCRPHAGFYIPALVCQQITQHMITIKKANTGHSIGVEVKGNEGDYIATLWAMITAIENTDNPDDRKRLGTLLKAMLPNEFQITLQT